MPVHNTLIAGIGGQGVVTLGTLFKKAALRAGIQVSGSERRGGAQREGHVSTIIRYRWSDEASAADDGPRHEVCSPMLPAGGAHLLIGLEPLEAVRLARYLNPESTIILNSFPLLPTPVKLGEADYPGLEDMVAMLNRLTKKVFAWDLTRIARENFGHSRAMNAICLGIACELAKLPVSEENLLSVLKEGGRGRDVECFRFGAELAKGACPHEVAS